MKILTHLFTGAAMTLFSATVSYSQETRPEDIRLTAEQINADITLAKEAFSRVHPGYTRYTDQATLDNAWDSLTKTANTQNGMTLGAFYLAFQDVLADIRCDHTKAELPKVIAKDRNITPVYLPVIWRVIDGRAVIENPGETDLSFGDEIITIDGRPISEMMDALRPLIPVDGYTDFVRDTHMGASLEFMGGAIDNFGALKWDVKPQALISVRTSNGISKNISVDRIKYNEWKALLLDGKASTDFPDAITFKRIGDQAAYFKIDSFVNYRNPVDPDDVYGPIFTALKNEGYKTLILDLRENGGGSTDAKVGLFSYLIDTKTRLVKDTIIKTLDHSGLEPHISTWEKRMVNPNRLGFKKNENGTYSVRKMFSDELKSVKPNNNAYAGKLLVLTSRSNGSATTALLAKLKDMGRATLIGEETGGSAEGTTAGVLFYLNLPESGIRARIPVLQDFNNVTSFTPNKGVVPDILAPTSFGNFVAGIDPAYNVAISMIDAK